MLNKTSLSAIRTLIHLGLSGSEELLSPRVMAEQLRESPTYLAKVTQLLTRAGILRAYRGVAGGVTLGLPPEEITLLAIVEACQGVLLVDFCEEQDDLTGVCAFHQATAELHNAIVRVLSNWTLADLIENPHPVGALRKTAPCWLSSCEPGTSPAGQ